MDMYLYRPLGESEAGKILKDLLDLVTRHKLSFKPGLYQMMKALTTVEGVGLVLDPKLQLILLAKPFMREVPLGRMQPGRIAEELSLTGSAYMHLLRDLPEELRTILYQLRSGRLRLEFEHRGLKSLGPPLTGYPTALPLPLFWRPRSSAVPWSSSPIFPRTGTAFRSSAWSAFWWPGLWGYGCCSLLFATGGCKGAAGFGHLVAVNEKVARVIKNRVTVFNQPPRGSANFPSTLSAYTCKQDIKS